jgi:hypothetical protein
MYSSIVLRPKTSKGHLKILVEKIPLEYFLLTSETSASEDEKDVRLVRAARHKKRKTA